MRRPPAGLSRRSQSSGGSACGEKRRGLCARESRNDFASRNSIRFFFYPSAFFRSPRALPELLHPRGKPAGVGELPLRVQARGGRNVLAPGGMRVKLRPKGPILFRPPRACPAGEEVRINPAGAQERGVFATEMARGEAAWSFLAHIHACISTRLSFLNFCLRWSKPTGGQPSVNCGPFVMTFAFFGLSLTRMPPGADFQVR
jgi:hypothetical protein